MFHSEAAIGKDRIAERSFRPSGVIEEEMVNLKSLFFVTPTTHSGMGEIKWAWDCWGK